MRKPILIACAVAALASAGAVAAAQFSDPAKDTFGPDITGVTLTTEGGMLHIDVAIADSVEWNDELGDTGPGNLRAAEIAEIDVDADGNAQTGDDGIDFYAVFEGGQDTEVLRFKQDDYVDTTDAHASKDADGVHLRIPLAFVGRNVKVSATTIAAPPPDQDPTDPNPPHVPTGPDTDNAPDTGVYTMAIARPTLRSASVAYSTARPRAGKVFAVRKVSLVLSSGTVTPSTTCSATLGGKKLAPAKACSWRIPANARGKSLRVSVTATYAGTAFRLPSKTFVVR